MSQGLAICDHGAVSTFYRASCGNFQKRTGPVVDFREEVLT